MEVDDALIALFVKVGMEAGIQKAPQASMEAWFTRILSRIEAIPATTEQVEGGGGSERG
jgi:hypothetical protein